MITIICQEIILRKCEHDEEMISSVYFGGGTPSLLEMNELRSILETIYTHYTVSNTAEITLEANPDDMTLSHLEDWQKLGINRLSVGIQSFRDKDLIWMNRAHNAEEASTCVINAKKIGFKSISVDLIYGLPDLNLDEWQEQIKKVLSLDVQHLSAYCLTVENRTKLNQLVEKGEIIPADEDHQSEQFLKLIEILNTHGFEQYEISNFCRPGHEAVHNSSYWKGEKYLGIGPSAHSFDGKNRRWNISNNTLYMKGFLEKSIWYDEEQLSIKDRFNELILTGLRTKYGVHLSTLESIHDLPVKCLKKIEMYCFEGWMQIKEGVLLLTDEGKLRADLIASELFI